LIVKECRYFADFLEVPDVFHAEVRVFGSELTVVVSAARVDLRAVVVNDVDLDDVADVGEGFVLTHDHQFDLEEVEELVDLLELLLDEAGFGHDGHALQFG